MASTKGPSQPERVPREGEIIRSEKYRTDGPCARIRLSVPSAELNPDGSISISVPVRMLSDEEHVQINRLFPNFSERAFRLLEQEALFECVLI